MVFSVVISRGSIASAVTIDVTSDEATVADLCRALGTDPVDLVIDGVSCGASALLSQTPLLNASSVEFVAAGDVSSAGAAVPPKRLGRAESRCPGDLSLVAVAGPDTGWSMSLRPGLNVLGRSPDVELMLDDPSLSGRHARFLVEYPAVSVADLGSTNAIRVSGLTVASSPVETDTVVWAGSNVFRVVCEPDDRAFLGSGDGRRGDGTLSFNRPPREAPAPQPDPVPVVAAPSEPAVSVSPFSVAAVVGPLLMAGVMVAVMSDPRFALFALLSPIGALVGWIENRFRRRKAERRWWAEREVRRDLVSAEVERWVLAERARRWEGSPGLSEWLRRADLPSSSLWERRHDHDDALVLSVGVGTVDVEASVDSARLDEDIGDLVSVSLVDVPIDVDLANGAVVGIVGDLAVGRSAARALVSSAAAVMGPSDLAIVVASSGDAASDWAWARWLPHVRDERDEIGVPWVVDGVRATDALDRRLDNPEPRPCRLLVVDGTNLISGRNSAARRLWGEEDWSGIVIAESEDRLPSACTVVVSIDSTGRATVRWPTDRRSIDGVVAALLPSRSAASHARRLARFDDPDTSDGSASLPERVCLADLVGALDEGTLARRWEGDGRLVVALGVDRDGALDIDLATDGPHVLIAGTTGSGKSELLRSMVASLAAHASPDDVNFILVDYKGGAAFDSSARLPHTVGLVTDLDDNLAERALLSLEAELRYRESRLRDAGVVDIVDLKRGTLPRLVVLVDEFATLASELPDFLDSLVGVAQRGRSLGVHLVLATQRPAGAVNDNIRANTNLRIALRVQDPADSVDVIGVSDAVGLPRTRPGRAVARIGADNPLILQTPQVTGPVVRRIPMKVELVGTPTAELDAETELEALVDAAISLADSRDLWPKRRPWLDPLPRRVDLADIEPLPIEDGQAWNVAMVDDPANQRQLSGGWNPDSGNLLVVGRPGSGPLSALAAIGRAAISVCAPSELHVVGFDLLGSGLGGLDQAPHTVGVARLGDDEMVRRIVSYCSGELARRMTNPGAVRPRLLVVIDSLASLVGNADSSIAALDRLDVLASVVRDGPPVGIHAVVAVDRAGAASAAWQAACSNTWVFEPSDDIDLQMLVDRDRRTTPSFEHGRAVRRDGLEIQIVGPRSIDWAGARDIGSDAEGSVPTRLATLPPVVELSDVGCAEVSRRPWSLPVGLLDEDLSTAVVQVHRGEHLLVAGSARSGVSSVLAALARSFDESTSVVVVIVAGERSPLSTLDLGSRGRCVESIDQAAEMIEAIGVDGVDIVVIVDDAHLVDDTPNSTMAGWLTGAERTDGPARIRPSLVIAGGRADRLRLLYVHWTADIRRSRIGILLRPDTDLDGDLFGVRLDRSFERRGPGHGVVVDHEGARIIQSITTSG